MSDASDATVQEPTREDLVREVARLRQQVERLTPRCEPTKDTPAGWSVVYDAATAALEFVAPDGTGFVCFANSTAALLLESRAHNRELVERVNGCEAKIARLKQ